MDAVKLCDAVNWQLQLTGMNQQDAQVVKTCVTRYTPGKQVNQRLQYFFHRVCNAVKCLLGRQTDWQLAEKTIENHIFSYVPSPCRALAKRTTQSQVHFVAGKTLQFLVWENKKELVIPKVAKTLVEGQIKATKIAVTRLFQESKYGSLLVWSLGAAEKLYQAMPNDLSTQIEKRKELCKTLFKEATHYLSRSISQLAPSLNSLPLRMARAA